MSEGSRHFEEGSAVFKALHKITDRLNSLGISYAVVGGMALFRHGLRRFTEDVDILVTKADLKKIHEKLVGLGYLPPFARSKNLRDTELGVRIEFLTTGDYPGDGKKKPVAFPDPRAVSFEAEGIRYIQLSKLVELKLASGMTSAGRLRDLSDVLELIKVLDLSLEFASQLDPFVQSKYTDLWQEARRRYVAIWSSKKLLAGADSIEDLISRLRAAAVQLERMYEDGIVLEKDPAGGEDSARLVTTDREVAERYGLVDELDYWAADQENEVESPTDQPDGSHSPES